MVFLEASLKVDAHRRVRSAIVHLKQLGLLVLDLDFRRLVGSGRVRRKWQRDSWCTRPCADSPLRRRWWKPLRWRQQQELRLDEFHFASRPQTRRRSPSSTAGSASSSSASDACEQAR